MISILFASIMAVANLSGTDTPENRVVVKIEKEVGFAEAAARVASARKSNPEAHLIDVVFAPGPHPVSEAFVMKPEHGGDAGCRVVYRSADPKKPAEITGGRRIDGWKTGDDGAWRVVLPDVAAGRLFFSSLFANGVRRYRPRLPETGYYVSASNAFVDVEAKDRWGQIGQVGGFFYEEDVIDPAWANREDIEITYLTVWSSGRQRIAGIDRLKRLVKFTAPRYCAKRFASFTGRRFWMDNVKEAFGRPGEWYLDRPSGILSYMPLPGENPENTVIEVPVADRLLRILGEKFRPVANVEFRDIVFRLDNRNIPREGSFTVQGAFQVPGAVELVRAEHVDFSGCVFTQLGGYALAFGPGARNCRVSDSLIRDIGAGGVKLGAPYRGYADVPEASNLTEVEGFDGPACNLTSGITVENCRITEGGRIFPDAVGILSLRASVNRFVHNEIDHHYYTGISMGWDWSGLPVLSSRNEAAFNHIHHLGQRLLSDFGFIYTLGRQPGTSVHDNYHHSISCFAYGGVGIYPDESSSGIDIYRNVVVNPVMAFHMNQNGSDPNTFRDNIFINGRWLQYDWRVLYDDPTTVLDVRRNVFQWKKGPLLRRNQGRLGVGALKGRTIPEWAGITASSNLIWRLDHDPRVMPGNRTLEQWQKEAGIEAGSIYADPLIIRTPDGGFAFGKGSPAEELGIEMPDVLKTGPVSGAPRCAAWPDLPAPSQWAAADAPKTIGDGRVSVTFDVATGAFDVTDLATGAKWVMPREKMSDVFSVVMIVRAKKDSLSFEAMKADTTWRGVITLSVKNGTVEVEVNRKRRDFSLSGYPYMLKPVSGNTLPAPPVKANW